MEHGSPDLVESLAQCQQRIGQLEKTVAEQQAVIAQQQAVIAQQQEMAAVYQEQLAQAAEQLRLLRRMVFGQRREGYTPSPDQKLLFVPEVVEGLHAKEHDSGEAATEAAPPRASRKRRRPRIEFPQFWEHRRKDYPLPPAELACGQCGTPRVITRTHVTKRLEMETECHSPDRRIASTIFHLNSRRNRRRADSPGRCRTSHRARAGLR
jgi:uncharacterized coiled-coil protein SlyX